MKLNYPPQKGPDYWLDKIRRECWSLVCRVFFCLFWKHIILATSSLDLLGQFVLDLHGEAGGTGEGEEVSGICHGTNYGTGSFHRDLCLVTQIMAPGLQEQKLIFYINPTNWKSGTNRTRCPTTNTWSTKTTFESIRDLKTRLWSLAPIHMFPWQYILQK